MYKRGKLVVGRQVTVFRMFRLCRRDGWTGNCFGDIQWREDWHAPWPYLINDHDLDKIRGYRGMQNV
jgi:hypothetical protein